MIHLAWGYLCAEDAGADETQRSDSCKDDHMLVTSPAEREVPTREVEITIEGDCAHYDKQGDKHRRKKCINHLCSALPNRPPEGCKTTYVAGPLRCKTGYACRTFLFSPYAARGKKLKVQVPAKAKAPPPIFERRCKGRGNYVLPAAHFVL